MSDDLTLRCVEGADELAAFEAILADCFLPTADEGKVPRWRERMPAEDRLGAFSAGGLVGTVVQIPMGQWFGGRSVRTMGVAAVGVGPCERGVGSATRMMRLALRKWRAEGFPLSTLYPSNYALYQGVGYERAGGRYLATVTLPGLHVRDAPLRPVPVEARHADAMDSLHRAFARANPGHLDRGPYIWDRIEHPREGESEGCMFVDAEGEPEGYAVYVRASDADAPYRIAVVDAVAATPRAARAFLAFLCGFRTIAERATWASAPCDPLLAHLPDRRYELRLVDQWMLRLLDVEAALGARGYPSGVEAELHLDVRDELLQENAGRLVLRVAGGRGEVSSGGSGRLSLDVRGLAALYTGHLSPDQLALAGLLSGPDADRAAAAAVFAGPAPWMVDAF